METGKRCGSMLLLALAVVLGCGDPAAQETAPPSSSRAASDPGTSPPSLVLVTIDTLRADRVSAYGYARDTTPNLDALAASGARFDAAYAMSSTTLPSHATLFSSRYPDEHGVSKNGLSLPEDVPVLAERLREHGWETAAFVSSFVLERRFGLARGFDHFDDDFRGAEHSSPIRRWEGHELDAPYDRRAADTTNRALAWLAARDAERPFLLWVHYFDPHSPYDPPEPHRSAFLETSDPASPRHAGDLYDGDVHYADEQLGRLVDALEPFTPLTVVTSDHGEGLWDHGWLEHGVSLYEEQVRVPLVLHWPGRIPAGRVVEGLVAHVDLVPTLEGLLGLALVPDPRGRDLSASLLGAEGLDPEHAVFQQRRHYEPRVHRHVRVAGEKHALRWKQWKFVVSPDEQGFELYDLTTDPGELRNLAGLRPDLVLRFQAAVGEWRAGQVGRRSAAPGPSREDLERLEALGYIE